MGRFRDGRRGLALVAALGLSACGTSAGQPASRFLTPAIARAYLPLAGSAYLVLEGHGAGVVVAPGIAVTNAHNANLVDPKSVIGMSAGYDLLFFRIAAGRPLASAAPRIGEKVIAYGQGVDGELRQASGRVRWTDAPVLPRCRSCPVQKAFAFDADAGKGFSGGPVVDARTGRLLGIVFGFREGPDMRVPGDRLMYAYDMRRVFAELHKVER